MKNQQINCKYYGSMRGCRYGNNCRYRHSNPNDVRFCHYYNNCQFGNNCRFRHIDFESQLKVHVNSNYSNTQNILNDINPMSNNTIFSQSLLPTMNYTPIIYPMIHNSVQQQIITPTNQHPYNETTQMMTCLPQKIRLHTFSDEIYTNTILY
eukprot:27121_1